MRKLALIMIALALGVLALTPTVAFAHHTDDHEQGPPDRQTAEDDGQTETTEDDDDDGEPNCLEPGDDGYQESQHPSGDDRYCEAGDSGNQGGAEHDPDDDGNGPDRGTGGADQPGGEGGEDQLDQDGNNGCGNDQDFEDDNEGLCGGPDREQPEEGPAPEGDQQPEQFEQPEQLEQEGAEVAGISETRDEPVVEDAVPTEVEADASGETAVLGIQLERAPEGEVAGAADERAGAAPSQLARTGTDVTTLLVAAALLLLSGGLVLLEARTRLATAPRS